MSAFCTKHPEITLDDFPRLGCPSCAAEKLAAMPARAPEAPCYEAPAGWHCTRAQGHEGPCAAVPDAAKILTEHELDCIQRIGRDEKANRTTIGLPELDALIESHRKLSRQSAQAATEAKADELYHACATIDWLADRVNSRASAESSNESFAEKIVLIHADLSATLLARIGGARLVLLHHGDKPGVPLLLAAAIIRLLDTCHEYNIPIGEALHETLQASSPSSSPSLFCRCGAIPVGPDLPESGSMVSPSRGTHYSCTCPNGGRPCDPLRGPGGGRIHTVTVELGGTVK